MNEPRANIEAAEIVIPCEDLSATLPFFLRQLGFRLDQIFPADDPAVAVISGYGIAIRLVRGGEGSPGMLLLRCRNPKEMADGREEIIAPNGTRIRFVEADPPLVMPPVQHAFVVRRLKDGAPWVIGRAGMHYRDLVPNRLGGSMIASHIRVPDAGPVPDNVHYHIIGFQMIYCYRGWVRLVYEDQGEPFILAAGDCVLQPPQIRHRVLESSGGLEVVEIGCPAEHVTTLDHSMTLPNERVVPDRRFGGQRFCRHEAAQARWQSWRIGGWDCRDTGIGVATGGVASVRVARISGPVDERPHTHDADIHFTFVLEGAVDLVGNEQSRHLEPGDAFVVPPGMATALRNPTADCELLEVTLPAAFATSPAMG